MPHTCVSVIATLGLCFIIEGMDAADSWQIAIQKKLILQIMATGKFKIFVSLCQDHPTASSYILKTECSYLNPLGTFSPLFYPESYPAT